MEGKNFRTDSRKTTSNMFESNESQKRRDEELLKA